MATRHAFPAIAALLEKMKSEDADFRYMALSDLIADLTRKDSVSGPMDDGTESQVVAQVLDLLTDANGEVKNMAVRCLGVLARRLRERHTQSVIKHLVQSLSSKDEELRDVSSLALKTVIAEVPTNSPLAKFATDTVAPELLAKCVETEGASQELLIDSLDALAEIFSRFSPFVLSNARLQQIGLRVIVPLLAHSRVAIRKRATTALSILAANAVSEVFTKLSTTISVELESQSIEQQKTFIQLVGALARWSPRRLGRRLPEFMPKILRVSQRHDAHDDDELKETTLQTMEAILLRCPVEVTPFINSIVDAAVALIKHDPNYTGGDDSDDEMDDGQDDGQDDDDDDDVGVEEDYSDDDDVSWKVRRAAAKALNAALTTRPQLLTTFVATVAPVLVSRFSEREESVRLEVLQTFLSLLRQVRLSAGLPQAVEVRAQSPGALKRKRDVMDVEDVEGSSPRTQLRSLVPVLVKALLKELPSKSASTRLLCTTVFKELTVVLDGGLDAHVAAILSQVEKSFKTVEPSTGAGSSLKAELISFTRVLLVLHSPRTYEEQLPAIVPILADAITAKAHRNSIEALNAASDLATALFAVGGGGAAAASSTENQTRFATQLYEAVMARLNRADSDQEIKEKGIACLGVLLAQGGSVLSDRFPECLPLLSDRLQNEVTRFATVKVIALLAHSSACSGPLFEEFLQTATDTVKSLLRQSNRMLKLAAFDALQALLRRLGAGLQPNTAKAIVEEVHALLSGHDVDVNLLPPALHSVKLAFEARAEVAPLAVDSLLPELEKLLVSPLLQGAALDAVIDFVRAAVGADKAQGQKFKASLDSLLASSPSSRTSASVARCYGAIARADPTSVPSLVAEAVKALEQGGGGKAFQASASSSAFSLLVLGEVGRLEDFAGNEALLQQVYKYFDSSRSEETKSAAAFALGNMAVGNLAAFLPVIGKHIEAQDKNTLLALGAMKELIAHGSAAQLTVLAEEVWAPLFGVCQTADEAVRSIGAECLARLTLTEPSRYLVQLQSRLRDPSASTRAAVIAAIRFTLTEASAAYDELLAPTIVEFLSLLKDESLDVRRHAVFAFNSAAQNKPHLIREHLASLLPLLYEETQVRKELMRKVTMGPFTVTQDDGLDLRKNAYETMYTLLDTCLAQVSLPEYVGRVIAGLRDDDQVKLLCYLILVRLADLAPTQVSTSLDEMEAPINESLKVKLKEGATKQDVEKSVELTRAAFRALVALNRLLEGGGAAGVGQTAVGGAACVGGGGGGQMAPAAAPVVVSAPRFQQLVRDARTGPSAALYEEVEAAAQSQQRV